MPHVYYIKNTITNKMYVGFTSREDYKERIIEHFAPSVYKNYHTPLYRSIVKYGVDAFEHGLLFSHDDYDTALQKEIELIELYGDYNLSAGGNVPPNQKGKRWNHTEETKQKMRKPKAPRTQKHIENLSNALKGKTPWNKGKKGLQTMPWKGKRISNNMATWRITYNGDVIITENLILWCENNGLNPNSVKYHYYKGVWPYKGIENITKEIQNEQNGQK